MCVSLVNWLNLTWSFFLDCNFRQRSERLLYVWISQDDDKTRLPLLPCFFNKFKTTLLLVFLQLVFLLLYKFFFAMLFKAFCVWRMCMCFCWLGLAWHWLWLSVHLFSSSLSLIYFFCCWYCYLTLYSLTTLVYWKGGERAIPSKKSVAVFCGFLCICFFIALQLHFLLNILSFLQNR